MVRLVKGLATKRAKDKRDTWAPDRPLEDVRQLLHGHGHEFFEVLDPEAYGKLYLDRDEVLPAGVDGLSDELLAAKRAEVRARVEALLGPALADGSVTFKIAERHGFCEPKGRWKLSFRPYVSGFRIKYVDIPRLLDSMHGNADGFWDTSVYKAGEQLMACVNGRKSAKDRRVLCMQAESDDVSDYLIQVVEEQWAHYEEAQQHAAEVAAAAEVDANINVRKSPLSVTGPLDTTGPLEDEAFVHDVVACLSSSRAEAYADWRNTGFALKLASEGTDKYLGLFKAFSRRSTKHQTDADQDACEKLWRASASNTASNVVTLGTLVTWAKQDDPVAFEAARERRRARRNAMKVEPESLQPKNMQDVMETAKKLHEVLELPSCIQRIVDSSIEDKTLAITMDLEDGQHVRVRVNCESLYVQAHLSDQLVAERYLNDSQATALRIKDVDLSSVHKDLRSDMEWRVSRPNDSKAVFLTHGSDTQNATIEMLNMNTPGHLAARLEFKDSRKTVAVKKGSLPLLQTAYTGAVQNALRGDLGMGWVIQAINNGIINSGSGTINITTGGAGASASQPRADGVLAADWWGALQASKSSDPEAFNSMLILVGPSDNEFFYYNAAAGLWHSTDKMYVASNAMLENMQSFKAGEFFRALSDVDQRYVSSSRGGVNVFMRFVHYMRGESKNLRKMDENADLLPFDNGVFELSSGAFRKARSLDFLTKTLDYSYIPKTELPTGDIEFAEGFFDQVMPVAEERELFLRMIGTSLMGLPSNKKFLVLQDASGGDNGKSMVLKALRYAFGPYSMPSQTGFLLASAHNNPDGHQANLLSYRGKRLATFDETDARTRIDLAKLKLLTGGGADLAARGAGERAVAEFCWTAFIIIACNNGCLPQVDASDRAFVNRMVPIPMRAKFYDNIEDANPDEVSKKHAFQKDLDLKGKLLSARMAIMHVILDAWARHLADGQRLPPLPAGCLALRDKICADSDPLLQLINETIDTRVNFNLERTDSLKGRRVLGFVRQRDLLDLIRAQDTTRVLAGVRVATLKDAVIRAMEARGTPLARTGCINGENVSNVFKGCSIVDDTVDE